MLAKLFLIFTVAAAVELALLLWVGSLVGALPILGLIVGTALLGSILARRQGLSAHRKLQTDLASGRMPQDALFDGIAALAAALLLVSPGIIGDLIGVLLMIPACRAPLKGYLRDKFRRSLDSGAPSFLSFGAPLGFGPPMGHQPPGRTPFDRSPFDSSPFTHGRPGRFDDGDVIDMGPAPKAEHP